MAVVLNDQSANATPDRAGRRRYIVVVQTATMR
jgi:hypothetical protein